METKMNIQEYMTAGVENIIRNALKVTLTNPAQSIFMTRFAAASKAASKKRQISEKEGEHIPAFLIASITSSCNLHCAGCYARALHSCEDTEPIKQLSAEEWDHIFEQAENLGISFILLAGGEPMIRRDVIEKAGNRPKILFPIFTNGTLIDDTYMKMLKKCRNLLPIFSIEGKEKQTDTRRGEGVYEKVFSAMEVMQKEKLLFGSSVTVTKENLEEVTSDDFIRKLEQRDCKALFFVEFVPMSPESQELAPGDEERTYMNKRLSEIREAYPNMIFLSFPGDEKSSGGCIAAGRGFFHINSHGGAEPCPFSPYSDVNVRDTSLQEALHSGLFMKLQNSGILMEDHAGGCVLFENRDKVESF
ncbi:MAG: radical SAM protein [Frisingicoccus sp.]|uniref:radical SAM protein n=1 Tax=Frisingicoccus sp. TaxID=1918627 RepID=UPI002A83A746|nr:radical SAM protein [Frisingicoccus sp.]MDY4835422.1 radical SAM protein [Frisingicoccus sp.]